MTRPYISIPARNTNVLTTRPRSFQFSLALSIKFHSNARLERARRYNARAACAAICEKLLRALFREQRQRPLSPAICSFCTFPHFCLAFLRASPQNTRICLLCGCTLSAYLPLASFPFFLIYSAMRVQTIAEK